MKKSNLIIPLAVLVLAVSPLERACSGPFLGLRGEDLPGYIPKTYADIIVSDGFAAEIPIIEGSYPSKLESKEKKQTADDIIRDYHFRTGKWVVWAGQNLEGIAESLWPGYGPALSHVLAKYNNLGDPNKIRPGQILEIPNVVAYDVIPGETLRSIAREELKDESRWPEILDLNVRLLKYGDADGLRAGMVIGVPVLEIKGGDHMPGL